MNETNDKSGTNDDPDFDFTQRSRERIAKISCGEISQTKELEGVDLTGKKEEAVTQPRSMKCASATKKKREIFTDDAARANKGSTTWKKIIDRAIAKRDRERQRRDNINKRVRHKNLSNLLPHSEASTDKVGDTSS